jgi:hypothetical protein
MSYAVVVPAKIFISLRYENKHDPLIILIFAASEPY